MCDKDIEEARLRKQQKWTKAKETFDNSKQLQKTKIVEGDMVLQHNAKLELDKSTTKKLVYKWIGLYYIKKAIVEKRTYELEEFNRTPVLGTHPRNQLKKFVKHKGFYELVKAKEEVEEEAKEETKENKEDKEKEIEEKEEAKEEEEGNKTKVEPTSFEIRVPTLTTVQQSKYVQYKEDNNKNVL